MSGPAENLYHLDFEVKTLTRCNRTEDTCATVAIQFLSNPEQTVCEIPPAADANKSDGKRTVGQGKKFTFALPGGGGGGGKCGGNRCGGPKPIRVTVRMYQDGRKELGSGELEVVPSAGDGQRSADGDEHTVVIKERGKQCGCSGGGSEQSKRDIVAMLAVRARAWCAGPVTAAALEPTGGCGRAGDRQGRKKPDDGCGGRADDRQARKKQDDGCCGRAAASEPTAPAPCAPRRQYTICPKSCPASCPSSDDQSQQQYTMIGCEIDGRKVDMRMRKKNPETNEVQQKIVCEAEAFANMVSTLVSEIQGMIPNNR